MNSIAKIVKTTIENLNKKNIVASPVNYEKEFFSLLKQSNISTDDFDEFRLIVDSLDKAELDIAKNEDISCFYDLAKLLNKRVTEHQVRKFLKHLSFFLSPSLDKEFKEEIDNACIKIVESPNEMLINNQTIRSFRTLTHDRITKDKYIFNEKSNDVKKLIDFISGFFKKIVNENKTTLEDITNIKDDLENLNLSSSSKNDLSILQSKLLLLAKDFEQCVLSNSKINSENQNACNSLYEQIEKLQENLSKAEEEKSIDFLTKVLTRRAYSFEVEKIEREFKLFDSKYALVFFDIDHFKEVNDTFGHDAGDTVLSTFASILKKLTRQEDIVSRFGGEEFICLVHYNNKLEIKNYLKRVKNIINGNKFIHEQERIKLTFCAGVSFRENYESYEQTIKEADNLLYKAKNSGRDKILVDNKEIY